MRCHPLATACAVLPPLVIAVCYAISASRGQVPACNPFLSGCTSISAACRQEPAIFLFRMVMLPLSALLAAFWGVNHAWLRRRGDTSRAAAAMRWLGWTGALFLILYVVFLGTSGDVYRLLRRFGTTLFFGCTGVAQLILSARLHARPPEGARRVVAGMAALGALMLLVGVAYTPVAEFADASHVENIMEWNFTLLMQLHFGLAALLWKREGIGVELTGVPRAPSPFCRQPDTRNDA